MPSKQVTNNDNAVYTTSNGAPVAHPYAAEKVGDHGPLFLQDFHHIDLLAHFGRERIPERVVHAKGAGAHGYFEVGNRARTTIRFSTVGGENGSADTARDPRGFAVKIRTDEVFFIRGPPRKFPHFIHTQKRDPQTHLKDPDMFWDYLSQNPESIHQLAGENPDYGIKNLFEAIENKKYPSWTVYQTMTPEQAESFRYNVLDLTKVWPHKEFPLRPIGKIVLDENPQNYFAEIEHADPIMQSRLFSYPDTHRHRLGVNYQQLPVNAPIVPIANFQRDGLGTFVSQGARPNYQSTISPLSYREKPYSGTHHKHEVWAGHARAYLSEISELDFEQPRQLYTKSNIAGHLGGVKSAEIKARQLSVFAAVDQGLSDAIAKAIGAPTVQPLKVAPASEVVPSEPTLAKSRFQSLEGNRASEAKCRTVRIVI
ncbi:catalase [Lactarius hengduanensis]|nr:catalase [Lactarius hengduanensis]